MNSEQNEHEIKRVNGRFAKGCSGNPGGKPHTALAQIKKAVADYEEKNGVGYWEAATHIAMDLAVKGNVSLLGKILDKFLPTKIQGEGIQSNVKQLVIIRSEDDMKKLNESTIK